MHFGVTFLSLFADPSNLYTSTLIENLKSVVLNADGQNSSHFLIGAEDVSICSRAPFQTPHW